MGHSEYLVLYVCNVHYRKLTAAVPHAGQHPRVKDCQHLFIFNVANDVSTDDISDFVNGSGLTYVALKCVSRENAHSKSFKLSLTPEMYRLKLFYSYCTSFYGSPLHNLSLQCKSFNKINVTKTHAQNHY